MSSRWLLGIFAVVIGSSAAEARSNVLKVTAAGTNSIAAAAAAAPAGAADYDSQRADHDAKHDQMVEQLASDRRAKLSTFAALAAVPKALPNVKGFSLSNENGAAFGFPGLSNLDQASVNLGFSVEPPDQALCVGNGFVFEGVNDAFAVYSDDGKLVAGPAQANAFFGVDFSLNVSDPRCFYDSTVDRWFVTMTEYDGTFSDNHIKIAVSQSGDPTGAFIIYDINVTNDGSDFLTGDCPCLGDQPLIGADANGFYISTNAFGLVSFEGAQLYALSKAALAANSAVVPGAHFDQLSFLLPDVEFSFSIQPSTTPPGARFAHDTEYLAQSMRALTYENRLAVFTINHTSALNNDPSQLSVSVAVTSSQVYVRPVPARQKDGPTPLAASVAIVDGLFSAEEQNLDGNDQRMSQLTYLDGQLWTAVGTALVGPGTPVRDGVAWFILNVSNGAAGPSASVAAQGYVAGPGSSHIIYPALGVNAAGQGTMVFTLTGGEFFPSAAFWKFGSRHHIHMLEDGEAPEDGFSAYFFGRPRWGDYSAAAVGPDGAIWVATEMIPGGARKRAANWGTFIGRSTGHECDDD